MAHGMLDSIVCVLKCFNAVSRFHVPADSDMGFTLEIVGVEEQRIAGLIYSHVYSYILIYHLEKKKKTNPSSSRGGTFTLPVVEGKGKGKVTKVLTLLRKAEPLLCKVECLDSTFTQPLFDARRTLVDGNTLRHRDVNVVTMEVPCEFEQLRDYNKGRRKQELLDVLHTL